MKQRPDWPTCIRQLEKAGLSQIEIARRAGTSKATINRIKNWDGYVPRWDTGDAILMCLGDLEDQAVQI